MIASWLQTLVKMSFFHWEKNLTFLRSVSAGRRRVSAMRTAGRFFGFELGVWTAQHLMKMPITMMIDRPITMHAHQFFCRREKEISFD